MCHISQTALFILAGISLGPFTLLLPLFFGLHKSLKGNIGHFVHYSAASFDCLSSGFTERFYYKQLPTSAGVMEMEMCVFLAHLASLKHLTTYS